MSDKPIWMRMDGLGNAIAGNQKPHWCQRNPVVPGAGKPDDSDVEIPYIATLSGGINVDEAAARQECQLCTALTSFFNGNCWEGCTGGVFTGQDCALICDTLIAHKTLLRKSRYEDSGSSTEPLYYWKLKNNKPVFNLMVTKKYTAIPIETPEWCLDASIALCYNPDEKFAGDSTFAYCFCRELCFYTPRQTTNLYCLCTCTACWATRGWCISEQVSDEYFYGRTVGGWRDDTYQGGDGYSSRPYQTLAQMLVPTGETMDPYEGFDTDALVGTPIPDWQDPGATGETEGLYCAPMMYLSAGDFTDGYETILKKTRTGSYWCWDDHDPYHEDQCYYCAMLYPAIQSQTLPGLYKCMGDGEIYKIVMGACSIVYERWASNSTLAAIPQYNMYQTADEFLLHVEYYEDLGPLPGSIVDGDASVTIVINPVSSGQPPKNLAEFTKTLSFYFNQSSDEASASAELVLEDGKTQADYGVTNISIVEEGDTLRRVDVTVDLMYCYNHDVGEIRVLVSAVSRWGGDPYSIVDVFLPEEDLPEDLVWQAMPDPGWQCYCRILPPRHF